MNEFPSFKFNNQMINWDGVSWFDIDLLYFLAFNITLDDILHFHGFNDAQFLSISDNSSDFDAD